MANFTLVSRRIGQAVLVGALGLLGWANWNEPNLHDYPAPVTVAALQLTEPLTVAQAAALRTRVTETPGVTACTVSADGRAAVFTYRPAEASPAEVAARLANEYAVREYHAPALPDTGPQCPVPQQYVSALEQLRFALNVRRFFVKV